jgi:hypothetical protein
MTDPDELTILRQEVAVERNMPSRAFSPLPARRYKAGDHCTRPDGKPYLFLGRYRLMVQRSSALSAHLQKLKDEGRFVKLTEVITHLKEDEAGYTPNEIKALV